MSEIIGAAVFSYEDFHKSKKCYTEFQNTNAQQYWVVIRIRYNYFFGITMKQIINIIHFLKNKTIDKQLNICLNVHIRTREEKENGPIK